MSASPTPPTPDLAAPPRRWWRAIGPGLITASVVFGPGSLLMSSNVGATYGYTLIWVLVLTAVLMATYVTMCARIGVSGDGTPCQLVAARAGRPLAVLIGLTVCGICTAFQFTNNVAIAATATAIGLPDTFASSIVLLILLNGTAVVFLYSLTQVYRWIERLMIFMVGLMLIAFAVNLLKVRPDVLGVLSGLVPSAPEGVELRLPTRDEEGAIIDPLFRVAALMATTFSVAAAFYQGSLVREKGWTPRDYHQGIADAIAGICILALISAIIMTTSGTVLRGEPAEDIGELAVQLQPLFGPVAHGLFCLGLLAAALSSFLINAMIGAAVLSDGLGLPARMRDPWPKRLTVLVLLTGMGVGVWSISIGGRPVGLIAFGQALTVLGNPLMAAVILWLANRSDIMGSRRNRITLNVLGGIGLLVVILLALRVAHRLLLQFNLV